MKRTAQQITLLIFAFAFMSVWLYAASGFKLLQTNQKSPPRDADAKALFVKDCASCHGKDGQAKTFRGKILGAQNLTDSKWQAGATDEHIFSVIGNGRKKMPAFGKKLSEEEIDSLVEYVRKLKN